MPEIKVDAVVNLAGTGKPNFPVSPTHSGGSALSTLNTYSYTSSGTEPSSPKNGAIWWDSSNDKVMVYINSEFKEISLNSDYPSSVDWKGTRGISFGGDPASTVINTIQYVNISAGSGNSVDFGDLTSARDECKAASSGSRMICAGGILTNSTIINNIDYIASATAANSVDFGDLETGKRGMSVCGDGTYGIFMGGVSQGANDQGSNKIQRSTIATTGNATDFGDLTESNIRHSSSTNDATRGVRCGGSNHAGSHVFTNVMDYITMANAGNATDFGDLLQNLMFGQDGVISDNTTGIFGGGYDTGFTDENVIQKITIQTTANATDFGDMLHGYGISIAGTTDGTTGVYLGGKSNQGNATNVISKVTIGTPGNATDFGDMLGIIRDNGSASGAAS